MRPEFVPLAKAMAAAAAQAVVEDVTPEIFPLPPQDTPVADGNAPDDVLFEEMVAEAQLDPLPEPRGEKPDLSEIPGPADGMADLSDLVPEVAEAEPLPEEAEEQTPEFVDGMLAMI